VIKKIIKKIGEKLSP